MKKAVFLFALLLAALALVACGDDNGTTTTEETAAGGAAAGEEEAGGGEEAAGGGGGEGGGSKLAFEVDPGGGLAYTTDEETSAAGQVTVELNNPQAVPHDIAFEDSGGKEVGKTEVITEGTDSTTLDLKPGDYTFFCTIPGHRDAGMEGTLKVE